MNVKHHVFRNMTGLAALALLFLPALLFAQPLDDSPSAVHFREKVDRLFERQCAKGSRAGVKIVSLQSGQVLFEKNNSELFVPASNMKVVTTAAALRKINAICRERKAIRRIAAICVARR